MSRLSLDSFSSVVLYLGYLFLLVILDFLVTGQSFGSRLLTIDSKLVGAQVLLVSWLPTGPYEGCMPRLGSTKNADTAILDVYIILRYRALSALVHVAGNYGTRPMSSYVANMLDRKEKKTRPFARQPCMSVLGERFLE